MEMSRKKESRRRDGFPGFVYAHLGELYKRPRKSVCVCVLIGTTCCCYFSSDSDGYSNIPLLIFSSWNFRLECQIKRHLEEVHAESLTVNVVSFCRKGMNMISLNLPRDVSPPFTSLHSVRKIRLWLIHDRDRTSMGMY